MLHDRIQVRRGRLHGNVVRKPRDAFEAAAAALLPAGLGSPNRDPEVGMVGHREIKVPRKHADNDVRLALQRHGLSEHVGPAAEARLPRAVGEHHRRAAGWSLLVATELASDCRRHAQRPKESAGHPQAGHTLCTRSRRQREAGANVVGGDRAERPAARSPIKEVQI